MQSRLSKQQKRIWGASLTVALATLALWSGPAPLYAPDHARRINVLERVTLGGVKQWISIRGHDRGNPVLLFLHGGPGSANLAKLRLQCPELEKHFVVVTWDQRGAGKSQAAFDPNTLSVERIASDTHESSFPKAVIGLGPRHRSSRCGQAQSETGSSGKLFIYKHQATGNSAT